MSHTVRSERTSRLPACLSVCLSDWLSVCLSICHLTVCLSVCLSVSLSVCGVCAVWFCSAFQFTKNNWFNSRQKIDTNRFVRLTREFIVVVIIIVVVVELVVAVVVVLVVVVDTQGWGVSPRGAGYLFSSCCCCCRHPRLGCISAGSWLSIQ